MKIFQLLDLIIRLFRLNKDKKAKAIIFGLLSYHAQVQSQIASAFWLGTTEEIEIPCDDNYDKVSLLLHMDGANNSTTFTDNSINNFTVTPIGNAQISTAQSVFGGSSLFLDGSDGINLPVNTAFEYGTNNYTVEFFIYFNTRNPNGEIIYDHRTGAIQAVPSIYVQANGILTLYINGDFRILNAGSITTGLWYHIALVRNSGTTNLFLNGTLTGTTTYSYNSLNLAPYFGYYKLNNTFGLNGYMDDLRITKGVARYTSNFTPPSAPFPNN